MKRRFYALMLAVAMLTMTLIGCGSDTTGNTNDSANVATETESASSTVMAEEVVNDEVEDETLEIIISEGPEKGQSWNYIYEEEAYRDMQIEMFSNENGSSYVEICAVNSDTGMELYNHTLREGWRFSKYVNPSGETYWWKRIVDLTNREGAEMHMENDGSFTYLDEDTLFVIIPMPISDDMTLLKDYDEATLSNWFPLGGRQEVGGTTDGQTFADPGENYYRFTRGISWTDKNASSTEAIFAGLHTGYICFMDDYDTNVRYIFAVVARPGYKADEEQLLEKINSFEPIDAITNGELMTGTALEGRATNHYFIPAAEEMGVYVTTYTSSEGREMSFCWEGPVELMSVAAENNGSLYYEDTNNSYRLRAYALPESPSMLDYVTSEGVYPFNYQDNNEKIVSEWLSYLDETECYVQGSSFDAAKRRYGNEVVFPITGENGYKGYAHYIFEGNMDRFYVFTYMEHESVYDDERALHIINSIQIHDECTAYNY